MYNLSCKAKWSFAVVCVTALWIGYSMYKTRSNSDIRSLLVSTDYKKEMTTLHGLESVPGPTESELNSEEMIRKRRRKYNELVQKGRGKTRVKRLPDVIGIGVKKCGTGALQFFLSSHPYIRANMGEDHYYDKNPEKGLDLYRQMQVPAADHELVFEKTPSYFITLPHELPEIILRDIPNVKLLLILCEPMQRALSDFAMRHMRNLKYPGADNFDDFVRLYLSGFRSTVEGQDLSPEWIEQLYWHENVTIQTRIFTLGLYSVLIKRWIMSYSSSNLMIINGEELLQNPGPLLERVQDFLHIPKVLLAEDFIKHPSAGLYCVRPYWRENYNFVAEKKKLLGWEEQLKCTRSNKGRSRSSVPIYTATKKTKKILKEFYEPFNQELYQILRRNMNW